MKNERICPVCRSIIASEKLYAYVACPSCRSFVYISDHSAEDDNRHFYNSWSDAEKLSEHPLKKRLFRFYRKKDRRANRLEYKTFSRVNKELSGFLSKGRVIMEVGFGQGSHLLKMLKSGLDAYGIDISENIVNQFQSHHPQYKDRVQTAAAFSLPVDAVYCSALLEHLDDPKGFIDKISTSLNPGGVLIIKAVPVLNSAEANIGLDEDISFWKPCHRIIFSHDGLRQLFSDSGYDLADFAAIDSFNYKVMSLHLRHGYREIEKIRDSSFRHDRLPGFFEYRRLCRDALAVRSMALLGLYIFRKR